MAAKEDLYDQSGKSEILRNILKICPTSELKDKIIGASKLKALALKDSTKVADACAIPHLVALLSADTPSVIQEDVIGALGNLALANPDNQGKVASAGAFPFLVALLSASTPPHVQEQAARALEHLVFDNPGNQGKVAAAGAIAPLVALLSTSTPAHVQQQAASALASLVFDNPDNQGMAASAGAITSLVALLSTSSPVLVQQQAASALAYLAFDIPDNQCRMGKVAAAGAIPLLVALSSTSTPAHVQESAAYALKNLVADNPKVQEQLGMLDMSSLDVCRCRHCVSKSKRMNGQTSHDDGSTSVLGHPVATTSTAEPVDSDKLMPELLGEKEREKALKETKAKAKREKKQRQKEKKKGKGKEEQLAAGQVPEGGGKDAEKQKEPSLITIAQLVQLEMSQAVRHANDVAHELIKEEEREKALKEAKAKDKKEKMLRQQEKKEKDKKGLTKDDKKQSHDQAPAMEDRDADAHLIQEQHQPAGGSVEGDAGEPSGRGSATAAAATVPNIQAASDVSARSTALTARLGSAGSPPVPSPAVTAAAATAASIATTTVSAPASASTSVPNTTSATAAAIAAATATTPRALPASAPPPAASHQQDHPIQPCIVQPFIIQPGIPGAVDLTGAMRPGMNPALISQLRQAAMGGAHPPPHIPSAVLPPPHRAPSLSQKAGGGRAAVGSEAEDENRTLCIVCMEMERNVCLQPCGHFIMCSWSCEEVLSKTRKYPMCRANVVEHVRLVWS
eukprot:gene6960-biopygen626